LPTEAHRVAASSASIERLYLGNAPEEGPPQNFSVEFDIRPNPSGNRTCATGLARTRTRACWSMPFTPGALAISIAANCSTRHGSCRAPVTQRLIRANSRTRKWAQALDDRPRARD
jgi:hypothetical protein